MAQAKDVDDARKQLLAQIKRQLWRTKNTVVSRMIKEHMSGPTGPSSVSVRSGQLRRSLDGTVATWSGEKKMMLVMFFGGGVPYARIHEYGGTITPKRAKNLAVPVGAAKTRAGVARYSGPTSIFAALKFILNKKTGKKLLVRAGRGPLEVLFVLVPSITLPPRLNFGKTFAEEATKVVTAIKEIQIRGKV
jgi:hypothetical protein